MTKQYVFTGADANEIWPLIRDFHYSRRLGGLIQHCYAARLPGGLFGDTGQPVAAAVFSIPPTRRSEPVLELSRLVRMPGEQIVLSQLLAFAGKQLKKAGHDLLVSYADQTHGHHGGVYQASGWFCHGENERRVDGFIVDGVFVPCRSCHTRWGTSSFASLQQILSPKTTIERHFDEGKILYWRALNVRGKTKARRFGLVDGPYLKPNYAACPLDDLRPCSASQEHPLEAAP